HFHIRSRTSKKSAPVSQRMTTSRSLCKTCETPRRNSRLRLPNLGRRVKTLSNSARQLRLNRGVLSGQRQKNIPRRRQRLPSPVGDPPACARPREQNHVPAPHLPSELANARLERSLAGSWSRHRDHALDSAYF